ncbi:AIR synthase family protein [Anaerotignum sp. MB30-C6]|uniref:AIR synthase family protein n=1 Tax=Anaerotignum sp. MB30-C6 TaxID=3070814 RepID=UPI0027DC99FC|nr:AIR synthase family protein [Anaerotignum sp. MB30-C6]WMI80648.1 AIR synthase family protein [Anaerotignum sp. MB30-C6]
MFKIGKIPPEILESIVMNPIRKNTVKRDDILLRPKTGEDCSVVDLQGEMCVLSTDPITGAAKDIGYLAVQINCNDIYSAGAEPVGILLTVLLPESSDEEDLKEIIEGALKGAEELGIEILGGHTEVTDAVCKPIVSAAVIGKSRKRNIVQTGGAQVGQDVIMTKWAGLEGTAIIAKEYEEELVKGLPLEVVQAAQGMKNFLSVGTESLIAVEHGATAMHDATEGGILGAVWEVAECSQTGVEIWQDRIPLKEETKIICNQANIDPLRLISSGTMIITTQDGQELLKKLSAHGIEGAIIGRITEEERILVTAQGRCLLEEPKSDAIYQVKFL